MIRLLRISFLSAVVLLTSTAVRAAGPTPSRSFSDWSEHPVMVWSDEFDGDSLNRDVWNVEFNGTGCGNHELQYYIDSPRNVAVRDGNLVLTARRESYDGHAFTSGRVNTRGKLTFTYGLVEVRVLLPETADGLWPAVWFMGDDIVENGWPLCGETDLLEMGHADGIADGTQARLFNGAVHYGLNGHSQQVGPCTAPYSLQDGCYHIFYLLWTPESIAMYVDDIEQPYFTIPLTGNADSSAPGYYFNKPNFMLVNLAVGGDFPGIHDPDAVTALSGDHPEASMSVDYIRLYLPETTLISER